MGRKAMMTREEALERRLDADVRNLAYNDGSDTQLLRVLHDCAEHYIEALDNVPTLVFRAEGALRMAVKGLRGER